MTQWNPFEQMEALQNRLSSFSDRIPARNGHHTSTQTEWAPPVDVIETAEEYLIRADLPGVNRKDITVTLEAGELLIKGVREAAPLAEGAQYVFNERPWGSFARRFVMPDWTDPSGIQAEFKHGVLTVTVKKAEQAKARTIAIEGD